MHLFHYAKSRNYVGIIDLWLCWFFYFLKGLDIPSRHGFLMEGITCHGLLKGKLKIMFYLFSCGIEYHKTY